MYTDEKRTKVISWGARILSGLIIAFGLPFYLGYGNPLPFIDPEYRLWDNLWLSIFPVMFTGLAIGWFFPRIGGYLVTVSVAAGLITGLVMERELIVHMLVPLAAGCLYLFSGYARKQKHDVGTS